MTKGTGTAAAQACRASIKKATLESQQAEFHIATDRFEQSAEDISPPYYSHQSAFSTKIHSNPKH